MNMQKNVSLLPYNTFGIDVQAKYFSEISSEDDLKELLFSESAKAEDKFILGGGSNILLTRNYNGIVIKNNLKGFETVFENDDALIVKAGAGEAWHELVMWSVDKNLGGLENLSLIPGSVGAAPIQNIGAYGAELKDVFYELEAININTCEKKKFSHVECDFAYRNSIFKKELKSQYFITSVSLKLSKKPVFNTAYGAIEQELNKQGITVPTVKAVSEAVIRIRRSKLPDPAVIGNAGSFFKNPEVNAARFAELKRLHPGIAGYEMPDKRVKLAAGWLIEQCGWKGKIVGNTGAHKHQALVLVNYGNATGKEILALSKEIQQSVERQFGVMLESEVNIL